jgi:hypothetical protein
MHPPRSAVILALAGIALACSHTRQALITSTATNIGVEIAQNPTTETPHAKLGYQRVEVAIVPTNRSAMEEPGNVGKGAADHGEVLMELRYSGIFDWGPSNGIYQRLAVGEKAVQQAGAALMFARDNGGNLDAEAGTVIRALGEIPASDPEIVARKNEIGTLYRNAQTRAEKDRIEAAVKDVGFASFDDFVDDKPMPPTKEQIEKIRAALGIGGN